MKCFYVYGIALALSWLPRKNFLHSRAQNVVNASGNTFQSANKKFDNTLNALHPMALLVEKENNKSYTFVQMIKQKDAADCIHAMIK